MRTTFQIALGLGLCGLSAASCSRPKPAAPPPTAASASSTGHAPSFTFVPPQPWQSKKEGVAPVEPPDLSKETWRVIVSQYDPIQFETPKWQPLPAAETVEVKMRPGSPYRCIVSPLKVDPIVNGFRTKLKAWVMVRSVLCSGDGFRTWIESSLTVRLNADGTRAVGGNAGALLRDWDVKDPNVIVHTSVLMRSDKEQLEPTYGPPQILANVPVQPDDD